MIKRVCAAAVIGLFASAVLGQTLGNPGAGSPGDRPLTGAGPMVGASPQSDRDRSLNSGGGTTTGAGGSLTGTAPGTTLGTGAAGTSTVPGTTGPTGTTRSTTTVGGSPTTVIAPAESGARGSLDGGAGARVGANGGAAGGSVGAGGGAGAGGAAAGGR